MLPKFSMAASRRTITPRLAMPCAPLDRVTLMMAGSSSGAMPTARAMANSSESMAGLLQDDVDGEDDQHQQRS